MQTFMAQRFKGTRTLKVSRQKTALAVSGKVIYFLGINIDCGARRPVLKSQSVIYQLNDLGQNTVLLSS